MASAGGGSSHRAAGRGRAWAARLACIPLSGAAPARLRLAWASLRFRAARADYYDYLADLMEGSRGRKTLRDIFRDDALRYGPASVRGALCAHWLRAYEDCGGDLCLAWRGTLPEDDLRLVRTAQHAGGAALPQTLRDLAQAARLTGQAWQMFAATLSAAAAALSVLAAVLAAVPLYTVPRLLRVFASVPADYYGPATRALLRLAGMVQANGPVLACAAGCAAWLAAWSLPNLTGPLRSRLDRHGIWRLYRDFHAIRFLALLSVLVRPRGGAGAPRLREALRQQLHAASPWQAWHLRRMLARIGAGTVGPATFDTGLIDRETWWFMADMIAARGMDEGMQRTRGRLASHTLRAVALRARALRWLLLAAAVLSLFGLAFWHYAVVEEMRRALVNFHAGR